MTEKFYVGTSTDCDTLRSAIDLIFDYPSPPATGPYSCTAQQRADKTAQWFALTKEQRDSKQFDPLWIGWTLRFADLIQESPPGIRFAIWIPATLQTLMTTAVANGVVFTQAQTLAMLAANVAALAAQPANWVDPP
jgi:hypothetical protein